MDFSQLFQGYLSVGTSIDGLWSMFIVVHLGLAWFFFFTNRPMLAIEKAITLVGYAAFLWINGQALVQTYDLYEAFRHDLFALGATAFASAPAVLKQIGVLAYGSRSDLVVMTHGAALVIVALLLLFRNAMIGMYTRKFPDDAARRSPFEGLDRAGPAPGPPQAPL